MGDSSWVEQDPHGKLWPCSGMSGIREGHQEKGRLISRGDQLFKTKTSSGPDQSEQSRTTNQPTRRVAAKSTDVLQMELIVEPRSSGLVLWKAKNRPSWAEGGLLVPEQGCDLPKL